MTATRSVFCLALLLLVSGPAASEVITHEDAGIQIWIPESWDASIDDDELTISDQEDDPDVVILFGVLPCDELIEAIELVDEELASRVSNLELDTDFDTSDHNGMPAIAVEGRGLVDGEAVDLGFLIVETPKGKILMAVGVGLAEQLAAHQDEIDRIVTSIAPIRGE